MAQKGKHRSDHILLTALACGATVEAAAVKAGVSERTVRRRLADPAFRQKLEAIQADLVQRTTRSLAATGPESVRTLLELHKGDHPAATRLGAARTALMLAMRYRETTTLEQRMADLEARLPKPNEGS